MNSITKLLATTSLIICFGGQTAFPQDFQEYERIIDEYEKALRGDAAHAVKCGLPAMAAIHAEQGLTPKQQMLARRAVNRPDLPLSYVTPDGRFRIHYATSGINAVNTISTIEPGVPDYVYEAGVAAQKSYELLVEQLGFRPHADDLGVDGPEFDFYIEELNDLYGETRFDFARGSGPSFILMDNDYRSGRFFTNGIDGLRVTVAHEYFHAVQLNYFFRVEDVFFFEMSSVWFEDIAYDRINDYFQYLPDRFRNLTLPLNSASGFHHYGSGIWLHYITKRLQTDSIVLEFWNRIINEQAIFALRSAVQSPPFNLDFADSYNEFLLWMYFTGTRADTVNFFDEGLEYPEIDLGTTVRLESDTTLNGSLASLSGRYFQFHRSLQDARFLLDVSVDPRGWRLTTLDMSELTGEYQIDSELGLSTISVPAESREDSIVVLVANVGMPPNASQFPQFNFKLQTGLGEPNVPESIVESPRPNPFRPGRGSIVQFPYVISDRAEVKWMIFSESGRIIREESLGEKAIGRHSDIVWDGLTGAGAKVASGVYFFRILAGNLVETTKFVLIRDGAD